MSSSNKINYSVRLNKSIERKIISESIGNVKSTLNLNYSYIGFGSLWFTDFIYFHKFLNLREMYSIERDKIIFERARYNVPYKCIRMVHGDSSNELSDILEKSEIPSITWLDYDGSIFDCASYQVDADTIVSQSKSGSIVLVTMNINNARVRAFRKDPSQKDTWKKTTIELLNRTFGIVDIDVTEDSQLTSQEKFIQLANPLFSQTISNSIYKSGNKKQFRKIFDFLYADNAEMVTQGFILVDNEQVGLLDQLNVYSSEYFLNQTPFNIEAPILTVREKYSIDQELPSDDISNYITAKGTFEHESKTYLNENALGFPINVDNFKNYAQLYKFYPTYSEIMSS